MNEAEERKAYDDWLHQSPEFADTIISAWDVWLGRAALAQPEPAAPTEPAPGWCKHCRQYTIAEPLQAAPTVVEPVAITAELVRALSSATASPRMMCKRALVKANGDFEQAKELLRTGTVDAAPPRAALKVPSPTGDEHIASDRCWCGPEVVYTDPVTGASVLVHRRIQ